MAADAQVKATKAESAYKDTPEGDQRCDGCTMFVAPDACTVVEGDIRPEGWCKYYQKAHG